MNQYINHWIFCRSLVLLYACLKRLRIWHNAAIKMLVGEGSCAENHPLLEWRNHLQAEVIGNVGELTEPSHLTLWRGQTVVLDTRVRYIRFHLVSLKHQIIGNNRTHVHCICVFVIVVWDMYMYALQLWCGGIDSVHPLFWALGIPSGINVNFHLNIWYQPW